MSKEAIELVAKVTGKDYGTFDVPVVVEAETEDSEDWFREVLEQTKNAVAKRLEALGFYSIVDGDKSIVVGIIDKTDTIIWEYQHDRTSTYESISLITVPNEVITNPSLLPRRLR